MLSRREFIAGASLAPLVGIAGCSQSDMPAYEQAAARIREVTGREPGIVELVRNAILAPSGHNTQPWMFRIDKKQVSILPDRSRRVLVVDPYDHHLYVSLGCAAENLIIASNAIGRPGDISFDPEGDGRIDISLAKSSPRNDELYAAILRRQSTRSVYDGNAVSAADLSTLEAAAKQEGVEVIFITDAGRRENIVEYVQAANDIQMDDPGLVEELKQSIRFNPKEAMQKRDGLFVGCTENSSFPSWAGKLMFEMFYSKKSENKKYASQIRSSSGVAVFVGESSEREDWINVGRSFQRFALQATALGIKHAHINQPTEVPTVRGELAQWLGIGDARPDLLIRFGYAPALPMSMRRPVQDVILQA